MAPRGIRNNNPGNIEQGDNWNGLASEQTDPRFCVFAEPEFGIRAMCKIFMSYHRRDDDAYLTIAELVAQWAPPIENPTDAYIGHISDWSGFAADVAPNLSNPAHLVRLCMAMARQENGTSAYSRETYLKGAQLALEG